MKLLKTIALLCFTFVITGCAVEQQIQRLRQRWSVPDFFKVHPLAIYSNPISNGSEQNRAIRSAVSICWKCVSTASVD